jgi:hypothetical protein
MVVLKGLGRISQGAIDFFSKMLEDRSKRSGYKGYNG